MFTRESNKIVCRKFIPAGIYREVMQLEDEAVVFCPKGVIEEFESFVSKNVRLRRAVNNKRITLQPLRKETTPKKRTAPKKTREIEEISKEED